ncbi:MAG: hypothetical protein PHW10_03130 [Candidatus Peribacteraceae bacterium]|nr:hypothetical protein [Candidatus Peribacteraceae bacterium]
MAKTPLPSASEKLSILFVPLHGSAFLEMLPVAEQVRRDGRYGVSVFLEKWDTPALAEKGFMLLGPSGIRRMPPVTRTTASEDATEGKPKRQTLKQRLWRLLPETVHEYILLRSRLRRCRALLRQCPAAAIVTSGDRHIGWETGFIRAGHERGIPCLVLPSGHSNPQSLVQQRLAHPAWKKLYGIRRPFHRFLAGLFPQWAYAYGNRRVLYLTGGRLLAAKLLGMVPPNPWVLGGSMADRVAAESEREAAAFREQGCPPEKIAITGRPSADMLNTAMQPSMEEMMREEMHIPAGKKFLLCAVPQLGEHGLLPWDEHWQEMEWLFATLAGVPDVAIVLSLHPKSDPARYRALAERHGLILATRRLAELLPWCSAFCATFSSTLSMAMALGKPCAVLGFYRLIYNMHGEVPGMDVVSDKSLLPETLRKAVETPPAPPSERSRWALLDGHCTERVVQALYDLISHPA